MSATSVKFSRLTTRRVRSGKGRPDYDPHLSLLNRSGYPGPLLLHGLPEDQVNDCVSFLRGQRARTKK